jgi:hypothetical protein
MTLEFYKVVVDSRDPATLARWWCQVLRMRVLLDSSDEVVIGRGPDAWPGLVFVPVSTSKTTKNRWHLDLNPDDHEAEVARVTALGATPVDVGQGDAAWAVLADPEGNEFCILATHRSLVD